MNHIKNEHKNQGIDDLYLILRYVEEEWIIQKWKAKELVIRKVNSYFKEIIGS